ncbi:hypothetical protein WR25_21973 [Diploscapter pachys]|uniref:Uncharacterized protein n=1 Tax=Diploscapter pachys TaxID=2018661 RepID=A0A2A2L950_9BILA|nr:hypothetical protein WR25_21973 [Diploscapter pachys]
MSPYPNLLLIILPTPFRDHPGLFSRGFQLAVRNTRIVKIPYRISFECQSDDSSSERSRGRCACVEFRAAGWNVDCYLQE